jgi:hypothetical protein
LVFFIILLTIIVKWKRNKTKPTKTKRNTMLDYFPHMSQERTGFDHHWTRILCIYSAGVCPFHLVIGLLLSVRSFVRPVVTLFRLSDTLLNFARTGIFISELYLLHFCYFNSSFHLSSCFVGGAKWFHNFFCRNIGTISWFFFTYSKFLQVITAEIVN